MPFLHISEERTPKRRQIGYEGEIHKEKNNMKVASNLTQNHKKQERKHINQIEVLQ